MNKKDNYNQIYAQLINENFLNNISNAAINTGKWTGKKIKQAFNFGKKTLINYKIRENLAKILKTSIEKYNNNILSFNKIIKNSYEIDKKTSIQQLKKYCIEELQNIQNEINKNKFLIENDIISINNILPESLLKSYLIEIQNLGQKTGKFILTLEFENTNDDIESIKKFINQQKIIILTTLENKYLQSTISQSNLYKQIYFNIIKQDIDTNNYNAAMTINGFTEQPNNTNSIYKINSQNNNTNKQLDQINISTKKLENINNQEYAIYKTNFNLCINKLKFYFNIINDTKELFKILFENEKIIKKILKQLKKKYNIKIQIHQLTTLSALYFIYGLLLSFVMPKFETKK